MSDEIHAAELVVENHLLRCDHDHGALHNRVTELEAAHAAALAALAAHEATYHAPEPERLEEEAAAAEEPEAEAAEDVVIEPLADVAEDEKPEAEPPPPSPHVMFRRVGGRE